MNAHGAAHLAAGGQGRRRAALPLLLVVLALRRGRRRAGHRGERLQPGHAVRREQGDGRAADLASSPTTTSARPTCATPRRTARRPRLRADIVVNNLTGTAFTRGEVRLQSDGSRRGDRWCTSRTSRAPSSRCSRPTATSCTTRPSTSGATRTSCRSATSPSTVAERLRRPRHLRRGRLARQARLPGRLRQGRPRCCPAFQPRVDGAGRASRSWPPTWSAYGLSDRGLRGTAVRAPRADQPAAGRGPARRRAATAPGRLTSDGRDRRRAPTRARADARPDGAALPGPAQPHRRRRARDAAVLAESVPLRRSACPPARRCSTGRSATSGTSARPTSPTPPAAGWSTSPTTTCTWSATACPVRAASRSTSCGRTCTRCPTTPTGSPTAPATTTGLGLLPRPATLDALGDGPVRRGRRHHARARRAVYGELLDPGETDEEVIVTSHVCHPSLANDNLSGLTVAVELAGASRRARRAATPTGSSSRPGTIGSLTWLSRNPEVLPRIRHGLVLTGLGGGGPLVYKRTRHGDAPSMPRPATSYAGAG